MRADEARGHTKVHIFHKNRRFLGPLCAWNSDIEDAGTGLEIELTIQVRVVALEKKHDMPTLTKGLGEWETTVCTPVLYKRSKLLL